jgi:Fic-DOC domain mobile mystery protein B
MGLEISYDQGQTPLDEDEKEGLRVLTIGNRTELDEFEQLNIEDAMQWLLSRSLTKETILSVEFVKLLHKRMFGNVWSWAGDFRKTNKNLGVDKHLIVSRLHALLDDTLYWLQCETYAPDEIAIRFKHRLVSIHSFPNGNGRHSRLMADVLIEKVFRLPVFSWGLAGLINEEKVRKNYIAALQEADNNCYAPLIKFARS